MNSSHLIPQSGLPQQQPQRYSDRHRQQGSKPVDFQSRSPGAAQQQGAADKSKQVVEDSDRGELITSKVSVPTLKSPM